MESARVGTAERLPALHLCSSATAGPVLLHPASGESARLSPSTDQQLQRLRGRAALPGPALGQSTHCLVAVRGAHTNGHVRNGSLPGAGLQSAAERSTCELRCVSLMLFTIVIKMSGVERNLCL